MTACLANPPCSFSEVPLEQIDVRFEDSGPVVGRKALAWPNRKLIMIDHGFWLSVPTVQGRAGLLAHERGHIEGARCEPCADRRAGEILRREGWATARDAQATALARLENRDASAAAADIGAAFGAEGWLDNRERAAGVDSELQAFLDELGATGLQYGGKSWRLTVGVDGGLRDSEKQRQLYSIGRAQQPDGTWVDTDKSIQVTWTLSSDHETGRAVDVWVLDTHGNPILKPAQASAAGVDLDSLYAALGARARGAVSWGGLGDKPHFKVSASSTSRPAVAASSSTPSGSSSSSSGSSARSGGDAETPPPLLSADVGDVAAGLAAIAAVLLFVAFA